MSKMIQVRNVPDKLHRALKVRAAQQGKSLSAFLIEELERLASIPTREEMLARLQSRSRIDLSADEIVRIIKEGRDERDDERDLR